MERKIYILENLDCANCAAKIEAKFNALPEVEEAVITFATRQLRLTAEDPDSLIERLTGIARTVEEEVEIHARAEEPASAGSHEACSHSHAHCGCGHHHEHEHCGCGHHHEHEHCGCAHASKEEKHPETAQGEKKTILWGAGLFAAGLMLGWLGLDTAAAAGYLAAYLVLGWEILATAWRNLRKGHVFDENFLMSIATIGALCIGELPEAVGVMLFYRVGELFEHTAVARSRSQIMEAVDLRPEVVCLADGTVIPAQEARVGDVFTVRPGDRIPLDGVVISGESRIDTAPITGEPVPVGVGPGSSVTSGCVNTNGQLTIRAEKPLSESMVTRILDSVENAAASKPKIDRFITRFARIYTPIVVALAAAVAIVPSVITGEWHYWVYTALSFLVMSCPCALVLSVPLAFFSGIGVGSRQGILFKGGVSIEAMGTVKAIAMDKTGTITKGMFALQQVAGGHDVLRLCASCEQHSSHPIALSITAAARERKMALFMPDSLEEIPGRGIRAMVDGQVVLCGNERLMRDNGVQFGVPEQTAGTRVLVAVDGRFVGFLVIADAVKDGAREAIGKLKRMGFHTAMFTGDTEETANRIARETGIDEVHARAMPDDKLRLLQQLRKTYPGVMYVGDGINDAPVLAGADVGAAMGSGADAAIEAADVVFMTSDVGAIAEALRIARQTAAIAWQNVVFALLIKFAVMVLGLLGCASMWMAVFADSGVAMLCVINSVRMLYRKR